jgi:hypothetical protein
VHIRVSVYPECDECLDIRRAKGSIFFPTR